MVTISIRLLLIGLIAVLTMGTVCSAQSHPDRRFLAVDLYGGYTQLAQQSSEENETAGWSPWAHGWHTGATVRFAHWWGATGQIARTGRKDGHQWQGLGGLEFMTGDFGDQSGFPSRVFGQVLGGSIRDQAGDGTSASSGQFVIGGGADFGFIRFQMDYVHVTLPDRPSNNMRLSIGGLLPLCLRTCRSDGGDGIRVRKTEGTRR